MVWPVSPWRRAFNDERCLPASVLGPVECCALARLICEGVISELRVAWGRMGEGGWKREVVEGVGVIGGRFIVIGWDGGFRKLGRGCLGAFFRGGDGALRRLRRPFKTAPGKALSLLGVTALDAGCSVPFARKTKCLILAVQLGTTSVHRKRSFNASGGDGVSNRRAARLQCDEGDGAVWCIHRENEGVDSVCPLRFPVPSVPSVSMKFSLTADFSTP